MAGNTFARQHGNGFTLLPPFLLTGVLLFFAMPGYFGYYPLVFVALVPLLRGVVVSLPGRSFLYGFIAGFVYNVFTLHWIVVVLSRYGGLPLAVSGLAMLLLAMYMAVYWGLFCFLLNRVAASDSKLSLPKLLLFAPVLWVGLEYMKGVFLTGFPWLDLGYSLYPEPLLIQAADIGGHRLLSFLIVLVNVLVYLFLWERAELGQERKTVFAAVSLVVLFLAYSVIKHGIVVEQIQEAPRKRVSAIQGNILQDEKWDRENRLETTIIYENLSLDEIKKGTDLLVWPETALPFSPFVNPLGKRVELFVRANGVPLITGAPTFTREDGRKGGVIHYYNSALLFNSMGVVADIYNKQHLVPFGEYVPLHSLFSFFGPLVETAGNFSAGTSYTPLQVENGIRAGVLICFESVFPSVARREVEDGANLLVNITNDAWYGRTSAPYQSMAMTVMRSVENKRAMVRAANTGVSLLVEPDGKILSRTGIFVQGAIGAELPLMEGKTFFVRVGHWFSLLCFLLLLLICFRGVVGSRVLNTGGNKLPS